MISTTMTSEVSSMVARICIYCGEEFEGSDVGYRCEDCIGDRSRFKPHDPSEDIVTDEDNPRDTTNRSMGWWFKGHYVGSGHDSGGNKHKPLDTSGRSWRGIAEGSLPDVHDPEQDRSGSSYCQLRKRIAEERELLDGVSDF